MNMNIIITILTKLDICKREKKRKRKRRKKTTHNRLYKCNIITIFNSATKNKLFAQFMIVNWLTQL